MANFTPPAYISNVPLQVAKNLRFTNSNGIEIAQLYPVGYPVDTPHTGYISLIGSILSNQIDLYNTVVQTLNSYNADIINLQTAVLAIQTSGTTSIPQVNGFCLNGNTVQPVNVITTLLVSNTCSYNSVLGTPTALSQAILAQCNNLASLPAFSQNSTMSGLSGWINNPATIAASENNQWVSYCDARSGISKALAAITPTCAQVIVNYQAVLVNGPAFNLYFNGYTFIPSGYTDNGSQIQITDSAGNILLQSFNIVTNSASQTPYTLSTSGSTLSPTSPYYVVQVTSNVINSSIGTSCSKVVTERVSGTGSSSTGLSYDAGTFTMLLTSGSANFPITAALGLSYTPRYANAIPLDIYSSNLIIGHTPYYTVIPGGFIISLGGQSLTGGTLNFDWVTFK